MEDPNIMEKLKEKGVTEKDLELICRLSAGESGVKTPIKRKKNGCFNCRWCKKVSYMDIPCMDFYCKRYPEFDSVTGQVKYELCRNITNCSEWEQGGIKGFIKRLFNLDVLPRMNSWVFSPYLS